MRTALVAALVALAAPAAAEPRHYLVLRGVEGSGDVPHEVVRKLLADELARHPDEFAADRPDFPSEPGALARKLADLKMKGYYVTVKVLEAKRELTEGAPGKRPTLARSVRLSLVGATIPDQQVAFGGVGESTAASEVGKKISPGEEASLLADAVKDAVGQAVVQSIAKLQQIGKPAAPKKRPPKG